MTCPKLCDLQLYRLYNYQQRIVSPVSLKRTAASVYPVTTAPQCIVWQVSSMNASGRALVHVP